MGESAFRPSESLRKARAKLLIELRRDPLLEPANVPAARLASLCGVPERTLRDWMRDHDRCAYLLAKYAVEEKAIYLLDLTLDNLGDRLNNVTEMSDKDLIAAAKLLSEIVARHEDASAPETDFSKLPPEQLRAIIEKVLPLLPPLPTVGPAMEPAPERM